MRINNRYIRFGIAAGISFILFSLVGCGSKNVKKARELLDLKLYTQAIELLEKEISENPQNAEAHFVLGNAYWGSAMEKKQEDLLLKTVKSYKTALTLNPQYTQVHYNLGVLFYAMDEEEQAVSELTKVLDYSPNHVGACTYLGYIYSEMADEELAIKHLKKSLSIQPVARDWVRLKSVEQGEEAQQGGTFIVVADSAPIYNPESNEIDGYISKYSVCTFTSKANGEYSFFDEKDPIFEPKKGWICECITMSEKYYDDYCKGKNCVQSLSILTRLPKPEEVGSIHHRNCVRKFRDFALNNCYDPFRVHIPGYKESFYSPGLPIPGEIPDEKASTFDFSGVRTGKTEKLTWTSTGGVIYHAYFYFAEVLFDYRIGFRQKLMGVDFVVPGSGDKRLDHMRVNLIREKGYWDEEINRNLLQGMLTKGLTREMVEAALGCYLSMQEAGLILREQGVTQICDCHPRWQMGGHVKPLYTPVLIFVDGRLSSWEEKE